MEKVDPDSFRKLKILTELDLSGNDLESLHMEAFKFNERLGELRLSGNPLTKLHGVQFPALIHLKLLDLSNCELSQLNINSFDRLTNLERLDLAGNKFEYISEKVFESLIKLKSLGLERNPWRCDCGLRSFRYWIVAQKFYLPLTCAEPGRLEDVQWSLLQSIDFACKPEIAGLERGQASQAHAVYADVRSEIILECRVRADPAPEVKWVRHGQVLTNTSLKNGRVYLMHNSKSSEHERAVKLTILKSDLDDAGEYFCVGTNPGGVVEKKLILKFQDAPAAIGTGPASSLNGKHGACHHHSPSWLWTIIGIFSSLVVITIVVMSMCCCNLTKRRAARAHDLKVATISARGCAEHLWRAGNERRSAGATGCSRCLNLAVPSPGFPSHRPDARSFKICSSKLEMEVQ